MMVSCRARQRPGSFPQGTWGDFMAVTSRPGVQSRVVAYFPGREVRAEHALSTVATCQQQFRVPDVSEYGQPVCVPASGTQDL